MFSHGQIAVKPLFDRTSCTYTYLVWDKESRDAILIDGVRENLERDLKIIKELGIKLRWVLETHVHADHITSAGPLAKELDAKIGLSSHADMENQNFTSLVDNDEVVVSPRLKFKTLFTPGHTDCSVCFLVDNYLFSGDTLFIRGCGRTDFQNGSSEKIFKSVRDILFLLPDDTYVFPGHNYVGEIFSTIGEEKSYNPRLKLSNSMSDFIEIMDNLDLALPAKIKESVPENRKLGFK